MELEESIRLFKNEYESNKLDKTDLIVDFEVAELILKELENSISKDKIKEKIKELTRKLDEPNNDRWEKDDTIYYNKIKAQIKILQEVKWTDINIGKTGKVYKSKKKAELQGKAIKASQARKKGK